MFARTERLLLRPAWAEDAPALFAAIGDEAVVRNLARAPWPYRLADAEAFLGQPRAPHDPSLLIFRRTDGAPLLIGGIGIAADGDGGSELGYWVARAHWGQGYASEAGRAMVAAARDALRLDRLVAGHFLDNPASGRVLRKLGFKPTGTIRSRHSAARGEAAPCVDFALDLAGARENEPSTPACDMIAA